MFAVVDYSYFQDGTFNGSLFKASHSRMVPQVLVLIVSWGSQHKLAYPQNVKMFHIVNQFKINSVKKKDMTAAARWCKTKVK